VDDPLAFGIPDQVQGLLGIAVGSAVAATIMKSAKDNDPKASTRIAVPAADEKPRLTQVFMLEEGALADEVIDITKFQNFAITIVLVVAYTALAIDAIPLTTASEPLTALPGLPSQFLTLLGISHAGYISGKLPSQAGNPGNHETVAGRNLRQQQSATAARAQRQAALAPSTPPPPAPAPPTQAPSH
jgi:hypothetical protein